MKKLLIFYVFVITFTSASFADNTFVQNRQYTCLNTHTIQQGEQYQVKEEEAKKRPFVFSIYENKLITTDNVIFYFAMKKGNMSSYSNEFYMLLLNENMKVGLVPKKSKGTVQFYFDCK